MVIKFDTTQRNDSRGHQGYVDIIAYGDKMTITKTCLRLRNDKSTDLCESHKLNSKSSECWPLRPRYLPDLEVISDDPGSMRANIKSRQIYLNQTMKLKFGQ